MDKNRLIGKNDDLPWYLPSDLAYFKQTTLGKPVVMGSTTFASIISRLKKPLPGRRNIILSRQLKNYKDVEIVDSIEKVLDIAERTDIFVIGGAQIYEQFLPHADQLYVTEIEAEIEGDTLFPTFKDEWTEVSRMHHPKEGLDQYDCDFVVYERKEL